VGLTRAITFAGLTAATAAAGDAPRDVVLLKRAGVTAYEEVSEEFGDRCRVRAKVVSFGDEGAHGVRDRINRGDVVVTVGQEALDAVTGVGARVIPTLAFHTPRGLIGPPAAPTPELLLKVLATARPGVKIVGAVYGPRSEETALVTAEAARRLGLTLLASRARSGPEAVRALRALAEKAIDAIWLPGDTDVITPQVFQYALRLQLERGMPVVAATRQQVHSGALLAVDFSPRAAGRVAAELANRVLEGRGIGDGSDVDLYGGARVTVNAMAARRLGVDPEPLLRLGAKIE
jgi:ABC transporter substrate binding protein